MKTVEQKGSIYLQREWSEWRIEKWLEFPGKVFNMMTSDKISGNFFTKLPKVLMAAFRNCKWEMIYSHVPMNSEEIKVYLQHKRENEKYLAERRKR